jgi:hypothetical protein
MILFRFGIIFILLFIISGEELRAFDTLRVTASLDNLKKEIIGVVTYHVQADSRSGTFEFQLFPQAYSSENTPYMQGSRGLSESFKRSKIWGGMDIDSVTVDGRNAGENLIIEYTRGIIRMPEISTGKDITIEIYFRTIIPERSDRLSYFKDEYLLDGWFPMPAILRDDGNWHNPYYGRFTELVGEYFIYDIILNLPKNMIAAAPSPPYQSIEKETLISHHYLFGPAHDFALALSPEYMIDTIAVDSTIFRFYYRKFEESGLELLKETARRSYAHMNSRVGKYQYKYLSFASVDCASIGGLETPGLIALQSPRQSLIFSNIYQYMMMHEIAHQWFYGMIGSDQQETPWLDEGLAEFFADKIMEDSRGSKDGGLISWGGFEFSEKDLSRLSAGLSSGALRINRPAYSFVNSADYFSTVYLKADLAVETFDNLLGDSLSPLFWRTYFDRFLFRHPGYDDFIRTAIDIGGEQWGGLLRDLLNNTEAVDYSITSLTSRKGDSTSYDITLTLRKKGNLKFPVDYRVVLANGDIINYKWAGAYEDEEITLDCPAYAVEAIIDPEHKFAIDADFLNNSLTASADNRPGVRLSSGMMFLVESLLSFAGGI